MSRPFVPLMLPEANNPLKLFNIELTLLLDKILVLFNELSSELALPPIAFNEL